MNELERVYSAEISIKSYLSMVRQWEIALRAYALNVAASGKDINQSNDVRDAKKAIRKFLNMARVIQKKHNDKAKTYKLNVLERMLADDNTFAYARTILSEVEYRSEQIKEGMRRRQEVMFNSDDLRRYIADPKVQTELPKAFTLIERNEPEELTDEHKDMVKEVLSKMMNTQVPTFHIPVELDIQEESVVEETNDTEEKEKETNGKK